MTTVFYSLVKIYLLNENVSCSLRTANCEPEHHLLMLIVIPVRFEIELDIYSRFYRRNFIAIAGITAIADEVHCTIPIIT